MGYLLPTGYEQYHQYAIRELGRIGHSIQFKPISRINREGTGITPYQALSKYKQFFPGREMDASLKNNNSRKTIEKVYAEVTGKGKYFCERI